MEMPRRLLIANRGEIAVRIIRACRLLGIQAIAIYSDADSEALHVKMADGAIRIGSAEPGDSYLNIEKIIRSAVAARVDALHPGYGFISENWNLAAGCEEAGIIFVGPSSRTLAVAGNKVDCKSIAQRAGIPVIPGNEQPLDNPEEARTVAAEIGYPILLKSAFGGGGRGIRVVQEPSELDEKFRIASSETKRSLGRVGLFIEKLVRPARHIEVQILSDGRGNIVHLGERECSIQRRHQKLLEVAPSPALEEKARKVVCGYAVSLAKELNFTSAGTVEFLMGNDQKFYFIEMNSRLQVEHAITEAITGIDIVKKQLEIASGEPLQLDQKKVELRGFAIECRINAEDPAEGFAPSSGRVEQLQLPGGPGVRTDSALYQGCEVVEYYDSLLAKVITEGVTFDEARVRMLTAMDELIIRGVKTTQPLQKLILNSEGFKSWQVDVNFLDRTLPRFAESLTSVQATRSEEAAVLAAASLMLGLGPIRQTGEQVAGRRNAIPARGRFIDTL